MNPLILLPLLFLAACKCFEKPVDSNCQKVADPHCPKDEVCNKVLQCDHYVDAGKKVDLELPDSGIKEIQQNDPELQDNYKNSGDRYIDWDGEPKYHGGKW